MTKTAGRRSFILRHRGYLRYVYVDIDESGEASYWEAEPSDVRSFPFRPSARLEDLISALDRQGEWRDGWHTTIDLDSGTAAKANLADFAAYLREHSDQQTGAWLDRMIASYSTTCGVP
jgi:hypothetical protein